MTEIWFCLDCDTPKEVIDWGSDDPCKHCGGEQFISSSAKDKRTRMEQISPEEGLKQIKLGDILSFPPRDWERYEVVALDPLTIRPLFPPFVTAD